MLSAIIAIVLRALAPAPDYCILPEGAFSFCSSALSVAKAVDCSDLGQTCYKTVAAMYDPPAEPDPFLVAEADCGGPACLKAQEQCAEAAGPAWCVLYSMDTVESCVNDAQAAGVVDLAIAEVTCGRMFMIYGP